MTGPEVLNPARDKTCVIHTLLHHTPDDATVSYAYRRRDDALYAARNAAEAHAADLRRADSALLRGTVAADSYDIVVEDYRSLGHRVPAASTHGRTRQPLALDRPGARRG
jgi:hypothetical protein